MINYEELIKAARNEGKSLEDIAKEFTSALNEASKPDPRASYLGELEDAVDAGIQKGCIGLNTAIKAVVMCVALKHPKWDIDIIKQFEESIKDSIDTHIRLLDCVANDGNIGETMLNILGDVISKSKNDDDDEKLEKFLKGLGL